MILMRITLLPLDAVGGTVVQLVSQQLAVAQHENHGTFGWTTLKIQARRLYALRRLYPYSH